MDIITPSFAGDYELCVDLNRSVLAYAPNSVQHHIIVPKSDLKLFSSLAGERTIVFCEREFLPRSFVKIPGSKYTLNLRSPVPPIRGWILQQVVKLSAASMK